MFRGATRSAGAPAHYGRIDLDARIANASPHALVSILFEELIRAMRLMRRSEQPHRRSEALSRALGIIQSLHDTLNFEGGGAIAESLSSIYGEARRLLLKGMRENDPAPIEQAETMITEIAESWAAIGEGSAVSL